MAQLRPDNNIYITHIIFNFAPTHGRKNASAFCNRCTIAGIKSAGIIYIIYNRFVMDMSADQFQLHCHRMPSASGPQRVPSRFEPIEIGSVNFNSIIRSERKEASVVRFIIHSYSYIYTTCIVCICIYTCPHLCIWPLYCSGRIYAKFDNI